MSSKLVLPDVMYVLTASLSPAAEEIPFLTQRLNRLCSKPRRKLVVVHDTNPTQDEVFAALSENTPTDSDQALVIVMTARAAHLLCATLLEQDVIDKGPIQELPYGLWAIVDRHWMWLCYDPRTDYRALGIDPDRTEIVHA